MCKKSSDTVDRKLNGSSTDDRNGCRSERRAPLAERRKRREGDVEKKRKGE